MQKNRLAGLLGLVCTLAGTASFAAETKQLPKLRGDLAEACKAFTDNKDWENAYFYCREPAYMDDAASRYAYSKAIYETGRAQSRQNREEALRVAGKAAQQGVNEAYMLMGMLVQQGEKPSRPAYLEALDYFTKAHQHNVTDAAVQIGMLYYDATKLDDAQKAKEWFTLAAKANNPAGQYGLGMTLYEEKDLSGAATQFKNAAVGGDPQAMIAISRFYAGGVVFPRSTVKAIRWLKLAVLAGREDMRPELTRLLSGLNDDDRLALLRESSKPDSEEKIAEKNVRAALPGGGAQAQDTSSGDDPKAKKL